MGRGGRRKTPEGPRGRTAPRAEPRVVGPRSMVATASTERRKRAGGLDNYYSRSMLPPVTVTPELGPLEMEVLGLLSAEEPLPVAAVQERLSRSGRELAYTTVMTVLVRLHEKGLCTRKKQGTRFLYAPAKKAPRVADGILARVKQSLFREDRTGPILALLEDEELSKDELHALRDMIDEKLKEKRR